MNSYKQQLLEFIQSTIDAYEAKKERLLEEVADEENTEL